MPYETHRDEFTISTDPARLDLEVIFDYLHHTSYWAKGRAREIIVKSIAHSENFGVYHDTTQVGYARVITDYATFAYLCDVFILPVYQGHGLGKWLMETILAHPDMQGLRYWYLRTRDAHDLYKQFGFTELRDPPRSMERPGTLG